jgi:hypothetical protein
MLMRLRIYTAIRMPCFAGLYCSQIELYCYEYILNAEIPFMVRKAHHERNLFPSF